MIGTATAIALGVTAAASAGSSIYAAKKGAGAQENAANTAADLQWKQFQQGREDLAPFREAGAGAVHQMSDLLGSGFADEKFTGQNLADDPGVAFRLSEGQKALERSASARGGLLSGGALKSLAQYSQGLASQEYANAYSRWQGDRLNKWNMLTGVANLGAGSAAQTVQAGAHAADAIGEAKMGAGNASAGMWTATGNAIGSSANSIGQYLAMKDIFKPKP